MVRSLVAIREVLKDGATLVLDSRNWEKLRDERPRLTAIDQVVEREGKRCVPIYLWDFPARWEEPHTVEIVLLFLEESGGVNHKLYQLQYWPFRLKEILDRLKEAGFGSIQTNYSNEADRYEALAQRTSE